jgi:hypothetical protein
MSTFDPNSREAEANAEIAATRIRRGVTTLLVAGFVATLLAGPLLEAGGFARGASEIVAPMPAAEGSVLARANVWIQEIERRFDERSALVQLVRSPAQLLLVRVLGQGNERARERARATMREVRAVMGLGGSHTVEAGDA